MFLSMPKLLRGSTGIFFMNEVFFIPTENEAIFGINDFNFSVKSFSLGEFL